jgi:hypothetical protein
MYDQWRTRQERQAAQQARPRLIETLFSVITKPFRPD